MNFCGVCIYMVDVSPRFASLINSPGTFDTELGRNNCWRPFLLIITARQELMTKSNDDIFILHKMRPQTEYQCQYLYACAFRRRMVVRPSVRPKPEIPSFNLYMVRWSTRLTVTVLRHVRPSGEVSGHLLENAWREWPAILHGDVSWPP